MQKSAKTASLNRQALRSSKTWEHNELAVPIGVETVETVDERDIGTPDEWIKRHPKLIRHTGRHPFNAEPPASLLMKYGLYTPSSLHYVRNHGRVPKLDWDKHRISISGLVSKPCELSMEELMKFPSLTTPVTFACDGNRRKELNMMERSRGFQWGSSAVGTAVWKGARLCDILTLCGVKTLEEGAKFVHFEGAEDLPHGKYATSIPIGILMDPRSLAMLAYEMNGERLPPDHGFPVRLIMPGFVGGRMVKWLSKITISPEESTSYYHTHDNIVLPSFVGYEAANSGGWWGKPEYILYELNLNSVITHPPHEETISLDDPSNTKYRLQGFAYAGGGRKVTRVEISLDNGKTWRLTDLNFPPNVIPYHLKCYTWCHWDLEVEMWEFLSANEVIVRAWDRSLNTQPESPTWNVLGMMNNCWYRVKVDVLKKSNGQPSISFQHPVMPGDLGGGWMVPNDENPEPPKINLASARNQMTPQEVAVHNKPNDCWVIINGEVLDLTNYLAYHPGGTDAILINGGKDATRDFFAIHSRDVIDTKEMLSIGVVVEETVPSARARRKNSESYLSSKRWSEASVIKNETISPDSFRLCLQLPDNQRVGLPVGQHVLIGADMGEHLIVRPYTPIAPFREQDDNGILELVIKVYFAGRNPALPQGGLMSQHLYSLKKGDKVKVKGPAGHVLYHGSGRFTVHNSGIKLRKISLVCGGTGITPIFQLISAVLNDPTDDTQLAVIDSNNTVDDILLRKELDELAAKHSKQLSLWYTVSKAPSDWKYGVGRVSKSMFKEHLFPPEPASGVFLCGPPGLIEYGCIPNLKKLGFNEDSIFEF